MKKRQFIKIIISVLILTTTVSCLSCSAYPTEKKLSGDVNEDSKITSIDYLLIKRIFKGYDAPDNIKKNADVNYDDKITSSDYVAVKKIFNGIKVSFSPKLEKLPEQEPINDPGKKITYTVSGVFSSNMVLQRDEVIQVWGWSNNKGGYIYGELFGEKRYAKIDSAGEWMLQFSPHEYTTEGTTLKIYPKNGTVKTFENILIGDVWLVSGQSNAEFMFYQMADYYTDAYDYIDKNDNIRLLKVDKNDVYDSNWNLKVTGLQKDMINKNNKWKLTTESSVDTFSAAGYMFAKEISEYTDVPQGMIMAAAGGCILQEFMDPETGSNYDNKNAVWSFEPNAIYKYYIAPFTHMSLRGVLFYQGESNQGERHEYEEKLIDFVEGWRENFDSDFDFYNFQCSSHLNLFGGLGALRCAQTEAYKKIEDSYIITTMDAGYTNKGGNEDVSHPYDKITIGKRAAHIALTELYEIEGFNYSYYCCPIPTKATWKDGYVLIDFENVGAGLKTYNNNELVGFEFIKANKLRTETTAEIVDKDTVKVMIPEGEFVAVGYAYFTNAVLENANLLNSNDIPTTSFRFEMP